MKTLKMVKITLHYILVLALEQEQSDYYSAAVCSSNRALKQFLLGRPKNWFFFREKRRCCCKIRKRPVNECYPHHHVRDRDMGGQFRSVSSHFLQKKVRAAQDKYPVYKRLLSQSAAPHRKWPQRKIPKVLLNYCAWTAKDIERMLSWSSVAT